MFRKRLLLSLGPLVALGVAASAVFGSYQSPASSVVADTDGKPPTMFYAYLDRFGFDADEVSIPAGVVWFAVDNYSGRSDVEFSFSRDNVPVFAARPSSINDRRFLRLTPGIFHLKETKTGASMKVIVTTPNK